MPSLPNTGDSNWGVTLNNFLLTARNSDGTLKNAAGSNGITSIDVLTQAEYDAIGTKSESTLYIIAG